MVDMCREKKTGMAEECRQSDGKRVLRAYTIVLVSFVLFTYLVPFCFVVVFVSLQFVSVFCSTGYDFALNLILALLLLLLF